MHFLCLGRATCRRSGEKTEDEEVPLTEHEASLWTNMCSRFFYWNTMFQFQTVGVASDRCRTVLMTRQLNVFKYSWLLVSNTRLLVVSSSWRVYLLMNPFNLTNLISSVSFFLYLTNSWLSNLWTFTLFWTSLFVACLEETMNFIWSSQRVTKKIKNLIELNFVNCSWNMIFFF